MANKITQLVNKDGDNLYPLSGGLLSDSVTTDMLQDESVTSEKIDPSVFASIGSFQLDTEIETPYTWVDGNKIYKYTTYLASMPNNASVNIILSGITDTVDEVIQIYGSAHNTSTGIVMPIPMATSNWFTAYFEPGVNKKLVVTTTNDRTTYYAYLTMFYTKTN